MRIEKIKSKSKSFLPGLNDLLNPVVMGYMADDSYPNMGKTFGNIIRSELQKNNILLGNLYGAEGISVTQLLAQPVTDTWYEIGVDNYESLPTQHKQLLDNYNLIIHDYPEGGSLMVNHKSSHTTASGGYTFGDINLPVFSLFVHSENTEDKTSYTGDKKLALVLNRKPRQHRLDFLYELDNANILQDCDWSLAINFDEHSKLGHFSKSPNVSTQRWNTAEDHPFVKKYRSVLPALLDEVTSYSEHAIMPSEFYGKYKWYVSTEAFMDVLFPTEKTFKGFLTGASVLTVAQSGFNETLQKLGFKFQGDYDHLEGNARMKKIIEIMKTQSPDLDIVEHNYKLMRDINFQTSLVVDELVRFKNRTTLRSD